MARHRRARQSRPNPRDQFSDQTSPTPPTPTLRRPDTPSLPTHPQLHDERLARHRMAPSPRPPLDQPATGCTQKLTPTTNSSAHTSTTARCCPKPSPSSDFSPGHTPPRPPPATSAKHSRLITTGDQRREHLDPWNTFRPAVHKHRRTRSSPTARAFTANLPICPARLRSIRARNLAAQHGATANIADTGHQPNQTGPDSTMPRTGRACAPALPGDLAADSTARSFIEAATLVIGPVTSG